MGIASRTGTLTAGSSREFTLAPSSALMLMLPPNCKVSVVETPVVVYGTAIGGNALRTHKLQNTGTFTYGPYEMGGVINVTTLLESDTTLTWTEVSATVDPETGYPLRADGNPTIIVSSDAPNDADGRPNGTIYIQTP